MAERMKESVARTFPAMGQLGTVSAADGWPLRTFDWPVAESQCGSILFLVGRGDFFEKYLETLAGWHDSGWGITSFDWRGQAGSGRLSSHPTTGHIDDFGLWINDLADFWAAWVQASPGPHVIVGHSMGGHLVLRAMVEKRIAPAAAILSAPMLGFDVPPLTARGGARLAHWLAALLPSRMPAWPSNEKPALPFASRQKFLTSDEQRYADELWWRAQKPELVIGPPSWQWMSAAYRSFDVIEQPDGLESVACPVLILGTAGDRLVSPAAITRCAKRMPDAELVMFDKSVAHEILREKDGPRNHALACVSALLERASG